MATKVIYFVVDSKNEQAEFRSDDNSDDLKGKKLTFYKFVRGKTFINTVLNTICNKLIRCKYYKMIHL